MQRFDLDFDWRGFELHPEIPEGGLDIHTMFPAPKVTEMNARLQEVAEGLGVPFTPRSHAPSTKRALALSAFAKQQGALDAWRTAAMDAHWRDGRDIEDLGVLAELATAAGLDADAALAFLGTDQVAPLLLLQRREAAQWGVTGIPTWFMLPAGWRPGSPRPPEGAPQPIRVVGCQPRDVVEQAAALAGATPIA